MDRYEGHCWLDWWANPATLLASVEVAAVINLRFEDGGTIPVMVQTDSGNQIKLTQYVGPEH